ncbi:MAG: hypothetical protein AAB337_00405, partial [Patescibacteria group bacterium]
MKGISINGTRYLWREPTNAVSIRARRLRLSAQKTGDTILLFAVILLVGFSIIGAILEWPLLTHTSQLSLWFGVGALLVLVARRRMRADSGHVLPSVEAVDPATISIETDLD